MLPSDVQTFRDGKYVTIPIADLVVGDIVQIQLGQQVPADLRLVECAGDTLFDRSILTGELRLIYTLPAKLLLLIYS